MITFEGLFLGILIGYSLGCFWMWLNYTSGRLKVKKGKSK